MNNQVKEARTKLAEAAKTADIEQIKAAALALTDAERVEAKELKAKAEADFTAKAKEREELTAEVGTAIHAAAGPFRAKIIKLVGEELALLRYSVDYKAGNLTECSIVRTIAKTRTGAGAGAGNGGGRGGKTKDEFGMSLNDIFEKFATDKDKADFTACTGDRVDSAQYVIKVRVKKAAITAGLVKPLQ